MTKKELAEQMNLSPMAISNYENGIRKPDMEQMKKIANALNVQVSDFLAIRNENLKFHHGDFRKNSTLSSTQQEYIHETVEEYCNRFMTVIEILGGKVLPDPPATGSLHLSGDNEKDAMQIRQHLNLAVDGPIDHLIEILENKGVLIYPCEIENEKFSGISGYVSGRPYIVFNNNMSAERNRSTIVHELAHLMFIWPDKMKEKDKEMLATSISGAFLFSKADAIRELGIRRTVVSKDMLLVAKEYGISMCLLIKRAQLLKIISDSVATEFFVMASKAGWRKNEPSRIEREEPTLFEQLVYRAINENEISVQKGAELLRIPYDEILSKCCFGNCQSQTYCFINRR